MSIPNMVEPTHRLVSPPINVTRDVYGTNHTISTDSDIPKMGNITRQLSPGFTGPPTADQETHGINSYTEYTEEQLTSMFLDGPTTDLHATGLPGDFDILDSMFIPESVEQWKSTKFIDLGPYWYTNENPWKTPIAQHHFHESNQRAVFAKAIVILKLFHPVYNFKPNKESTKLELVQFWAEQAYEKYSSFLLHVMTPGQKMPFIGTVGHLLTSFEDLFSGKYSLKESHINCLTELRSNWIKSANMEKAVDTITLMENDVMKDGNYQVLEVLDLYKVLVKPSH